MYRRLLLAAAPAIFLLSASAPAQESPPTFNNEVVRILQARCQACHRPGEHAPFSLITYRDAYDKRDDLRDAIRGRVMPPWKPVPGFGDFLEPRRLPDAELRTLVAWVEAGAPEGDAAKLPPPLVFPTGWRLGTPDHILEMPEPYTVAARASDVYSCFGGPGFTPAGGLSGWAPGIQPRVMADGVGMLLPKGAKVVVQMHYNNESPERRTDRTRLGLHFAKGPIDKRQRSIAILDRAFAIPPGATRHEVRASFTVPPGRDLHANSIAPHMHLLGREMKVTATYPDGTVRPLIHIEDWDFNWQGNYTFAQPVPLPGGTRIDMVAVFDNSAENLRQPSKPPREVYWGEGTTDEMAIVFIGITADGERIGWRPPAK